MKMKKFINNPENLTPELLEGFAMAHKDLVTLGRTVWSSTISWQTLTVLQL